MVTKVKGTTGVDRVESSALISNPVFDGTGTFSSGITVDTNTLHVDATNHNVGIGTTTPSTGYGGTISNVKLALRGSGVGGNNGTSTLLMGGDNNHYSYLSSEHTGGGATYLSFGTAGGASNPTERMRINSSGQVTIATQTAQNGCPLTVYGDVVGQIACEAGAVANGFTAIFFRNPNGVQGQIATNSTSVSYQTTSDYRLKENVVDMDNAINRIKLLQPKRFNFIADETDETVDGFLAHEVQSVVPEAISGTHNEVDDEGNPVYQGIDQSKLVPLLTSALQEAITKIEDLETRIQALESV